MNRNLLTQKGLTLIEMMIALVLGLLVVAVVGTLYTQSKRSYNQDEQMARMQENARYALREISRDLSMIGFFGGNGRPASDSSLVAASAKCGIEPLATLDNQVLQIWLASDAGIPSCLTTPATGSHILMVAYTSGAKATSYGTGSIYVPVTNAGVGNFLAYGGTAPTAPLEYWEYLLRVYYVTVENNVPVLKRAVLTNDGTNPLVQNDTGGTVAEGVEDIVVEFGMDTDGDCVVDKYVVPTGGGALPAGRPLMARIFLLMRGDATDGTFNMAGASIDYKLGSTTKTYSDQVRRRVYSATAYLRNMEIQCYVPSS
ncbi:MAG TPA: PilW family protein [Methylococcaceae bacterium]|nr:PilW family protein [Methylococcaceae bacterium]